MAIHKNNGFILQHYLEKGRDTIDIAQLPFFFGAMKNNPPALRRFLEAIFVEWATRSVADGGTLTVNTDDVVIFAGHSSTITLPALTTGRVLVIKDVSGVAGDLSGMGGSQAITVNRAGSDTIAGSNTSFSLGASYGSIILVGNLATTTWHSVALV